MKPTLATLTALTFLSLQSLPAAAGAPASTAQADAILQELQAVESLLARRDVAAGTVAAGILPAVEDGFQPPGSGYGTGNRSVATLDATSAATVSLRRAGSPGSTSGWEARRYPGPFERVTAG